MIAVGPGVSAAVAVLAVLALVGCTGSTSDVERAQANVTAKQKDVDEAKSAATAASASFCTASKTYIESLDRYGDVLTESAPTVGDVTTAGSELAKPRQAAFDGAEKAVAAQDALVAAEAALADAQAALESAKAGPTGSPSVTATPRPTATPLVPAATVDRVEKADTEFSNAQKAITDQTALSDAAEQFNSAAVALEFAWLRLFVEAGCVPDERAQEAEAAVSAYVTALQQDLATAGYYGGAVDGVYGPETVAAVQQLQAASGLPETGAVDRATAAALQAKLAALGGAASKQDTATTAAVQQTLKLAGFWTGPVDGVWTPALTDAITALQAKLGIPQTGAVDAATVSAFQRAVADAKQPAAAASPTPTPSR